jgi:tRNA threonylcarbamoyladenosine biosynthesis protein TsaE
MPVQRGVSSSVTGLIGQRGFSLADETDTIAFGQRLAAALLCLPGDFPGMQVQMLGDLGAGKTSLVRATLRGLGVATRVRSPTYTLVEPYELSNQSGPRTVYHFDLYRFTDPTEWIDSGFRDYLGGNALCLIEWPQRAGDLLGTPDLSLTLDWQGDGRVLDALAFSEQGKQCLDRC